MPVFYNFLKVLVIPSWSTAITAEVTSQPLVTPVRLSLNVRTNMPHDERAFAKTRSEFAAWFHHFHHTNSHNLYRLHQPSSVLFPIISYFSFSVLAPYKYKQRLPPKCPQGRSPTSSNKNGYQKSPTAARYIDYFVLLHFPAT